MKSKQLAQIIRKLVKEEVKKEIRSLLTESNNTPTPQTRTKSKKYTQNSALNDILNETVQSTNYDTLKTFNASDARAGFTSMQQSNPIPDKDISGAPMNPSKVTPDVMKALTRDYRELVKRFDK
jgi:hypothetical protein